MLIYQALYRHTPPTPAFAKLPLPFAQSERRREVQSLDVLGETENVVNKTR